MDDKMLLREAAKKLIFEDGNLCLFYSDTTLDMFLSDDINQDPEIVAKLLGEFIAVYCHENGYSSLEMMKKVKEFVRAQKVRIAAQDLDRDMGVENE